MKDEEIIDDMRQEILKYLYKNAEGSTEFARGLLCGAIDALSWTLGETDQITPFCKALLAGKKIQRKRLKKQVVVRDHFAA